MRQSVSERLVDQAATLARLLGGGVERTWTERAAALQAGVPAAAVNLLYPLGYINFESRLTAYARLCPKQLGAFLSLVNRVPVLGGAFSIDRSIAAFQASGFEVDENGWPVLDDLRLLNYGALASNAWYSSYGWTEMVADSVVDLARLAWAFTNPHRFTVAQLEKLVGGVDYLFREIDTELPDWPW